MPESEVVRIMRAHKAALLAKERSQMEEMARRWLGVERRLMGDMNALAYEMAALKRDGGHVSRELLMNDVRYRELMVQLSRELEGYSEYAERTIEDRQAQLARLGIRHAEQSIGVQGIRAGFNRLPVEAVQSLVGLAGNGSPLRNLLVSSWPLAADGLTQALVDGVALGYNPRKVARNMAQGATGSLDRMMVIARTEQLRVYRTASLESYRASSVVTGYKRLATHDSRVCAACLMDEGTFYELDEEMPEHPQGRCAMIPVVEGVPQPQWQQGQDWFLEQDAATQKDILGKERYYRWQNGEFDLDELVTVKRNPVWGDSLAVTTLDELTGPKVTQTIAPATKLIEMAGTPKPYVSTSTGQTVEDAYEIGRFGNKPIGYREMSFTGKLPDANAMRKIADEIIGPALSRVPDEHLDLLDFIFIQDFEGGFVPEGSAGARGITINAIQGKTNMVPSGVIHEIGHLVHQNIITEEQARRWAAATGWDDLDTAFDMMRGADGNKYYKVKPYEYIGPTEYGTFHPTEAFAEAYRLKYQGDLNDLADMIEYPEEKARLGALLDRILE